MAPMAHDNHHNPRPHLRSGVRPYPCHPLRSVTVRRVHKQFCEILLLFVQTVVVKNLLQLAQSAEDPLITSVRLPPARYVDEDRRRLESGTQTSRQHKS